MVPKGKIAIEIDTFHIVDSEQRAAVFTAYIKLTCHPCIFTTARTRRGGRVATVLAFPWKQNVRRQRAVRSRCTFTLHLGRF